MTTVRCSDMQGYEPNMANAQRLANEIARQWVLAGGRGNVTSVDLVDDTTYIVTDYGEVWASEASDDGYVFMRGEGRVCFPDFTHDRDEYQL